MTPYHHLLYNILRGEQERRVSSMPTGKDRAVLPGTQEKAHLHSLLGQVSKAPRGWERGQERQTLWTEIFPHPSPLPRWQRSTEITIRRLNPTGNTSDLHLTQEG